MEADKAQWMAEDEEDEKYEERWQTIWGFVECLQDTYRSVDCSPYDSSDSADSGHTWRRCHFSSGAREDTWEIRVKSCRIS
jgi:hypothetical protein